MATRSLNDEGDMVSTVGPDRQAASTRRTRTATEERA